jgi:hypothetical protein
VHATAACAGDELPAFCRAPRSIFSRPPSKLSVAPRLPCSSTTHTIHLVRRLSSATCFDRRHGIAWCPFQLPLSLASSSRLFFFPVIPIVRRVLSGFHSEARRPTAQISQTSFPA